MSIESADDRLELLKSLGELATFNNGQALWDVYGVLEREFVAVDEIESYRPVFTCRTYDTESHATKLVSRGTELVTDDGAFTVVGVQPDGTGMTNLILEES